MKNGDPVMIEYRGGQATGWIILISENQRSLMLGFPGMLGGYVQMMPVLEEDGVYRDVLIGEEVKITPEGGDES